MNSRNELFNYVVNFENITVTFNGILAHFEEKQLDVTAEISAIKEKLISSLKKDNLEVVIEEDEEDESKSDKEKKDCSVSLTKEEEREIAVKSVINAIQVIRVIDTFGALSLMCKFEDLTFDIDAEVQQIKKKFIATLLDCSLLPNEYKEQIQEDIVDEIDLDEDEEQVIKNFDIGCGILHKYTGKDKKVVVPTGVERISGWAFYEHQKKLKSIQFPRSLEMICEHAFVDCIKLKEVTIPGKVTDIEKLAFYNCKRLERVHFENPNIVKIGNAAFENTPWMNNALKADGALIVGSNLLKVSPTLTKYEIPSTITSICGGAFAESLITDLVVPEGVTYIGEHAFDRSSLKHISLPNSLTHVDDYAFANCEHLEEVTFSENVEIIGDHALYNLPNCVITILNGNEDEDARIYDSTFGWRDFLFGDTLPNVRMVKAPYGSKAMRCAMRWNIPFTALNGNPKKYTYIDDVFCCEGTKLHNYLGHEKIVKVPDGIIELGNDSFRNDYGGTEHVYLPESVKVIEHGAFCWCASLKSVEGPGVEAVGKYSFSNSENLEKLVFPALKNLSEAAFDNCPSLTEENLIIPEDVIIEERGFSLFSLMHKAMEDEQKIPSKRTFDGFFKKISETMRKEGEADD